MKRGPFLAAAGVVALVAAHPLNALAFPQLPTLHGDGENDDTAAIQALVDGKPYMFKGAVCQQPYTPVRIPAGHFRITEWVEFRETNNRHFIGAGEDKTFIEGNGPKTSGVRIRP